MLAHEASDLVLLLASSIVDAAPLLRLMVNFVIASNVGIT